MGWPFKKVDPNKALEIIEKTGDALWYTSEEKAEGRIKRQQLYIKLQEVIALQSTVMAEIRRELATSSFNLFAFNLCLASIYTAWGKMDEAAMFLALAGKVFWLVAAFVSFYVGPDAISAGAQMAASFKGKGK